MKIWVAGQDATDSLGKSLSDRAASLQNPEYVTMLEREADVLKLRDAKTTADHLQRYITLMRRRFDVNPALYTQPRTPGLKGTVSYTIRMFLWRLLRYQHFWMAFHQNGINAMHAEGLDFEQQERRQQTAELEARVRKLEQTIDSLKAENS
jgi:hypothetical protein